MSTTSGGGREAVLIEVVRTPLGRRNGALAGWHPVDLLAELLRAAVERTKLDPALVDDVIAGCVNAVGEQSRNIGRHAALAAGFPESVPGTTIDRQCGSGQQAIHFAAQGVVAGAYDVAIACGVESMSRVPLGAASEGPGRPFGDRLRARYDGRLVPQGISAELVAERWNLDRAELDAYAVESHRRAARARDEGRFAREIVPIRSIPDDASSPLVIDDEGIRDDTSIEKLAALRPAFKEGGRITAATSSQITDGAAVAIIAERSVAERLGLRPRARFAGFSLAGDDPVLMLTAPIPATRRVLERTGLSIDDMDAIEVNEAFAPVPLAFARDLGADLARVNPNGGAIALGHPVGATGVRLTATLLHELERTGGRYGLQTICEFGGTANALILERL
jgi:acetyl-CoA acyltransferase